MSRTIVAVIKDRSVISTILQDLHRKGFHSRDIGIAVKETHTISGVPPERYTVEPAELESLLTGMNFRTEEKQRLRDEFERNRILLFVKADEEKVDEVHRVLDPYIARRPDKYPGDLHRIEDVSHFEIASGLKDPTGWDVYGMEGEKIGEVKLLLGSSTERRAHLAIIDAGGFWSNKLFAIPIQHITFEAEKKRARIPFTKDQIKNAPQYDETAGYVPYFNYWQKAEEEEDLVLVGEATE